jgi:hypothetical protein
MGTEEGDKPEKTQKPVSPADSLNQDVVYHYSRERRLERASPAVRALYTEQPRGRGLFQAFRTNPTGVWVFFSILIVAVFMFVYALGNRKDGGLNLGGNTVTVSALNFPGATYVLLKKKAAGTDSYTGPVELALSISKNSINVDDDDIDDAAPVETRRIFFSLEPEEDFRLSLPFAAAELLLVIRADETVRWLRFKPE